MERLAKAGRLWPYKLYHYPLAVIHIRRHLGSMISLERLAGEIACFPTNAEGIWGQMIIMERLAGPVVIWNGYMATQMPKTFRGQIYPYIPTDNGWTFFKIDQNNAFR